MPIDKAINATKTQLAKNDSQTTNQITKLLEIILKQNYFMFQGQIYQPDEGEAMGSPMSGTIAEIFLQRLEEAHIKHLLNTSGVPSNFVRGGSTNSVQDRGQRERGSGGGSPLVRGSGGSCNLVQEISFHIVKFS